MPQDTSGARPVSSPRAAFAAATVILAALACSAASSPGRASDASSGPAAQLPPSPTEKPAPASRSAEEIRQSTALVVHFEPPGCTVDLRRMNGALVDSFRAATEQTRQALFRVYGLPKSGAGFIIRVARPGYRTVERGIRLFPRELRREHFLLVSSATRHRLAVVQRRGARQCIVSLWPDGGSQAELPLPGERLGDPAWAPDGSKLAFVAWDKGRRSDIFIWDRATGNVTRLTDDPAPDYSPAWSPDGALIAFVSERRGEPDIFLVRADGSGLRCLSPLRSAELDPCFSRNGHELFYASDKEGSFDIYARRLGAPGMRRITDDPGDEVEPACSPTSDLLAYTSFDGKRRAIVVRDLGNPDALPVVLSPFPVEVPMSEPAWSADGKYLAFVAEAGGHRRVYITAPGEGWAAPVALLEQDCWKPSWCRLPPSPDLPPLLAITIAGRGRIVVELDGPSGKQFVQRFLALAQSGFYNGLVIYRKSPGIAVETGCPLGNGTGGTGQPIASSGPRVAIRRGSVAFIADAQGMVDSRFLIALADLPESAGKHPVIGHVVSGLTVAERLVVGDRIERISRIERD